MDYVKEYKHFVNSHYFSDGVRITIGVALPAILLSYFNLLNIGLTVSIGALCASITDTPGPIHHRKNGLWVCNACIFLVALLTGLATPHPLLLAVLILVSSFSFSMLGVYGNRAASIGTAALLAMVLSLEHRLSNWDVLLQAGYMLIGGVWYTLLSLSVHQLGPYVLPRQALGECILETANYLKIKAAFYRQGVNVADNYEKLVAQQLVVNEKQDIVRELLFKSRLVVKESTATGRILVMLFLDIVDLFERAMASHQDYLLLHHIFDNTGILEDYHHLLQQMVTELENIGIAVTMQRPAAPAADLRKTIKKIQQHYEALRSEMLNATTLPAFIGLKNILGNIENIARRIGTLNQYTSFDKKISQQFKLDVALSQFISHQEIDWPLLRNNLTLDSNIFRHSLRVSIAALTGLLIARILPFGHGYWILLTIMMIMKPAYGLTKQRNYERLIGTIIGGIIGALLILLIKEKTVLFVLMLIFMLGTYSLIRINYTLSVLAMTPYILLVFNFLKPGDFDIVKDRIIDTFIGSGIALAANYFIFPVWEHQQLNKFLTNILRANANYFSMVAKAYTGSSYTATDYKLARKQAYVHNANLAGAFQRMLAEPKAKQKNITELHQFVVASHMLSSHIATLASYAGTHAQQYPIPELPAIIQATLKQLESAIEAIDHGTAIDPITPPEELQNLQQKIAGLMEQRLTELQEGKENTPTRHQLAALKLIADQFQFIFKISTDMIRICKQIK